MRQQLLGIVLLTCMAVPFFGTFSWLSYEKIQVRKAFKKQLIEGIHKEDLILLKFTPEEDGKISWEHDNEFEYKGQMYDVVEKEVVGGVIHYWCWLDYEETELNKKLRKLVAGALDDDMQRKEKQCKTMGFYQSLYFYQQPPLLFQITAFDLKKEWFYDTPSYSHSLSPVIPPPKRS